MVAERVTMNATSCLSWRLAICVRHVSQACSRLNGLSAFVNLLSVRPMPRIREME